MHHIQSEMRRIANISIGASSVQLHHRLLNRQHLDVIGQLSDLASISASPSPAHLTAVLQGMTSMGAGNLVASA